MTAAIQDFQGKFPKQLWPLFFSEMWERFCFYGMRGMLVIFMVDVLLLDTEKANLQYGATQAFVYAFTFIGGLFADKILGFRKSLFWGGMLMIAGSVILAIDPKSFFFLGISFTIIGTGFFKPNITTIVGMLYKDGDARRDAGFSAFYAGINLGALLGGYLCISVGNGSLFSEYVPTHLRWNVAFSFAAVVMIISLLTFINTQKKLGTIGMSPLLHLTVSKRRLVEAGVFLGSLVTIPILMTLVSVPEYTDIFMAVIGPAALLYLFYEMRNFSLVENKKLIAALIFILFSIVFWGFFEQSGGSLSLYAAENLHNTFFGLTLDPNGVNNSANSLFVILFATLVGLFWVWLSTRKLEPSTTSKFGFGFLFLAGGFLIFFLGKNFASESGLTSLELFTLGWLVITFGELCLSPIGMSAVTKLAPEKIQGVMMGMWFLASAYGQYMAGILGAGIAKSAKNMSNFEKLQVYTAEYKLLALYALLAGILLLLLSPYIKRLTGSVK